MARKITYLKRAEHGTRKLSREARTAMAEAGKRNLAEWHARAQEASGNAVAEIDAFI